ncbi:3-methylcrotonoyl-CoA carboxylase subunit alpha [Vulcanimicrobium alpinum]|uniref:Biotin-dependent 3-methylcrotonyl-coenzyme A carboxylase alpha1 subunit n=1 Tax=Vulcanimicrobium alpinum TaxID=3016050 RepID=A0AAN1XVV2_UNVUL|nr:3-methylcrotonoyl-CoA carboxylase subunit alpha [Vulcanimicrobium alpinum]
MIRRLLIANRGEIAVRIARGAREMGISPVGVYSDADAGALFRTVMDETIRIGHGPATESYLDGERIVAAAKTLGADAIHPGYGFLSEREPFARLVVESGLIFVGPTPDAIAAMGSKIDAKRRVRAFGVPVVPGYDGDDQSDAALRAQAEAIGTPVLIKASAGGGGRGMRVVDDLARFDEALASARREAIAAFGDGTVLLERYLRRPRHIEFQILADVHGTTVHLGERECSIQRRHQKVVEEAPSVALDPGLRATMGEAAVNAARSVGYTNAGTAEFMLDDDGRFYFLEMNARLQVEHPVTELVYDVDLVHEQLRIANGEALRFSQADLTPRGWAIEVRFNAEDPAHDFLPQSGRLASFDVPRAPGVRLDTGFRAGDEVPVYYDSMLAKIIVWGTDRPAAIARMAQTLAQTEVSGIATNLLLLRAIVADDAYRAGDTTTRFLDERMAGFALGAPAVDDATKRRVAAAVLAHGDGWRLGRVGIPLAFVVDGEPVRAHATFAAAGWTLDGDVQGTIAPDDRGATFDAAGGSVAIDGRVVRWTRAAPPSPDAEHSAHAAASGEVTSPMPGKIIAVEVVAGAAVEQRALLVVLEAMKMEHRIEAPLAGTVTDVRVKAGDLVTSGATLLTIGA